MNTIVSFLIGFIAGAFIGMILTCIAVMSAEWRNR